MMLNSSRGLGVHFEKADTATELEAFIRNEVATFWAANRKAMLLSSLGLVLRRDRPELLATAENGLQRFIERTAIAQIVRHPSQAQKIGAVPLTVPLPDDINELFTSTEHGASRRPRLVKEFWDAFHTPFVGSRYVIFDDGRVSIVEGQAPEAMPSYEITHADVVEPTSATLNEKIGATWDKIVAWLARNKLDIAAVTVRNQQGAAFEGRWSPARNSLARRLACLSPADQARISIPLDLVAKLLEGE
jgi:hypothetical protein